MLLGKSGGFFNSQLNICSFGYSQTNLALLVAGHNHRSKSHFLAASPGMRNPRQIQKLGIEFVSWFFKPPSPLSFVLNLNHFIFYLLISEILNPLKL